MTQVRITLRLLTMSIFTLSTLVCVQMSPAQDVDVETPRVTESLMDTKKHPVSVTMALQADSFFGFNPQVYGTYGLTDNVALAFNFTYWTMISGIGVQITIHGWKPTWDSV